MGGLINRLKIFHERKKLAAVGRRVLIHYSALLNGDRSITIEDDVVISRLASISGKVKLGARTQIGDFSILHTWGGEIEIGPDCSINPFCVLYGHCKLKVGKGVRIAARVIIAPINHVFKDRETPIYKQGTESRGIIIEDNIWIGAGAIILDGVRIGNGTVVAAGAVVTRDVESYKVVAGIPARVIKDL